ncbi:MAG: type I 3-dehydroquinate dehydratase [Deltaproteobacteria bacterium]|nr:type I 3-dehydroquinate dehydratase [Deltaproteobacteria bacterium]MBW1922032.1 type I 3-dehydroquinate dehydratase [Deltaproteobacteria bacterium]MBW1949871.1 type I 3-dehydroquinate dehydratase [Deltaproteobacteria bacterium]MBW2008436.1 type I 3-dehydroquinate dehydratase [Deltaproteobacteria bacterium]MBW2348188.1 type I 3-dehydroquinate dehydratase [Deltaproteobacteria bacterium]
MICVSITARDTPEALAKIHRAEPVADLMELRLDLMETFDVEALVAATQKPVIATYRSRKEGGAGRAGYAERVRILTGAAAAGARWIDVEFSMPLEFRREIAKRRGESGLLISCHLRNGTPSRQALEERLRRMAAGGAHGVKIVSMAREPEDNLRVLSLIPLARRLGTEVVAFCLGELGRPSRVLSPLLGASFTFASLDPGEETAPGQLPLEETRWILEKLRGT